MEINRSIDIRACKRLFLLTGFSSEEKRALMQIIVKLGGKWVDTLEFVRECTHVISAKPLRSEKFLCGCASGKWVLTPLYIRKSFGAMKWLREELFEWSAIVHSKFPANILSAPRRWRHHVFREGKGAFADWTVFVMVEDIHRRPEVYQRLIEAGGGKTISLPRGSSRNKEVFVDCITHVIVDHCYASEVQMFARAGVPCLHPEYLAEFLFQVHPRIKPYLITDQQKQKEETRIDEIKKSCKKVPRVYLGNSRTELLTSTSQVPSPIPEVRGQQHTPSCSSASPSKVSKRKLHLRQDIAGTLEMRKRRKMVHHQPCVPPWVRSSYKTFKSKDNQSAVPFTQAQQYIIDASIEEKQVLDAIVTVESYISTKHYPPAQLLHIIMQLILKTKDNWLAVACIKVLQSTLCMHGPALNPQMTEVYLDALLDGPREVRALHKYITTCDHWDFLYIVIKLAGCKRYSLASKEPTTSQADDGNPVDEAHNNAVLLLEFLTYQIEEDFTAWKNRKEYKLPISNCGCMIARIIWPASRKRYPSRLLTMPFKQLIKNVMKNLVKTEVPVAFGDTKFKILKHLLSLLNMAAEYCTYETQQCTTELNLAGSLVTEFSMAVASQIIDSGIHDNPEKLSLLLSLLQPQWLKLNVMQGILDRRHQSILETREAERLQSTPLTMNKIVHYYFWMVPEFKTSAPPPESSTSRSKKGVHVSSGKSSIKPLGDSNIDKRKKVAEKDVSSKKKMAASINKRNMRGETQLHVACIRNQVDKLKQLLTVPEINVNATDHAGWTPLHEAANHGHTLCVKELLKFKPKSEGVVITDGLRKPVDLLAAPTECGTTALHDAVFNGHVECARLLVDAGGETVLCAKNKQGFTPLDMANSEQMQAALRVVSRILADHNKENHLDSYKDLHNLKHPRSPVTDQEDVGNKLSERQYISLLGPRASRRQVVSEQSCECYCVLVTQLLLSYASLRELRQIKQDMSKQCTLPSPTVNKKESLRPNQRTGTDRPSSQGPGMGQVQGASDDDRVDNESEQPGKVATFYTSRNILIDDVESFASLGRHLKQFVEHMERLGAWENGLRGNKRCQAAVKTVKLISL